MVRQLWGFSTRRVSLPGVHPKRLNASPFLVPPVPLRLGRGLAVVGGLGEKFHVRGSVGAAFGEGNDVVHFVSVGNVLEAALSEKLLLG